MKPVYIAIGANLSNPKERLLQLPTVLAKHGVYVRAASSLWRNPAWPESMGYPDYLNGVLDVEFDGKSADLLGILLGLERDAGRQRNERNAPRPLDLDIIDFRGEKNTSAKLTLPHLRMSERAFVLLPLVEIAPNWRHPHSKQSALELLAKLPLKSLDAMKFVTHISL
ncbi:MAG: 2-amino-4-hydroxy-6-hydroxymethyldihydropteridine diphosphokinase [Maricaulaceae bacterium]